VPAAPKKKTGAIRTSKILRAAAATIPTFRQLTFRRGTVFSARLAPDGSTVIYSAAWDGEPVELFSTRAGLPESRSLGFRHPRLSPKGNSVAFLEHPFLGDDRGSVSVVDVSGGERRILSDGWAGEQGLGWSSETNEIWFTAAEAGFARALHGVTPGGKQRIV